MRALVVGCGSIGSRHATNLATFDSVDVETYDIDETRARSLAEGIGGRYRADYSDALADEPAVVLVCTPPDTHVSLASQAIEAGADVFVEKPLSNCLKDADDLVERAETHDSLVMVGCNMRYHPPVVKLQEWLESGAIGRVEYVRLEYGNYLPNWRDEDGGSYSTDADAGGGVILDSIHELDLAAAWLPSVETVYTSAKSVSEMELEVEDAAEILLESDSDAVASIHLDYIRPERGRRYELVGTDGIVTWDAMGKNPERSTVSRYDTQTEDWERIEMEDDLNEMYVREMEDFIGYVRQRNAPEVDVRRGRYVLDLALTAKRAAREGRKLDVERS